MIAAVTIAAAVTVLAVADDHGGDASPTGMTALSAAGDDRPAAPWRSPAVRRAGVPAPWRDAWDRAANRATCALLHPTGGGPELQDARPTSSPTPRDKGWDIFLNGRAGSVEVLGLFDRATGTTRPPVTPSFTRSWADGSVAKYAPDVGQAAPGTYEPDASPFEAVLTLPDQSCVYRIYDTLGRAHLESVFDGLRLMEP